MVELSIFPWLSARSLSFSLFRRFRHAVNTGKDLCEGKIFFEAAGLAKHLIVAFLYKSLGAKMRFVGYSELRGEGKPVRSPESC